MDHRSRHALVLATCVALAGCATVASHDEYDQYRAVRLSGSRSARLGAMQRYIEAHPRGFWADELRGERGALDDEVWEDCRADRAGLERYLSLFPRGNHAAMARQRLRGLAHNEQAAAEANERWLAAADRRRRERATRTVTRWTTTLVGLDGFGAPMADVAARNPRFAESFGEAPAPTCSPSECLKRLRMRYAIPVPGATRIERELEVIVRLSLERGQLRRAEILMPGRGFSRWYEMEHRTVVTDEDPAQRATAWEHALSRIVPAIETRAGDLAEVDAASEPLAPLPGQAESLVFPVVLRAFQTDRLGVSVLAASPDDYESAIDAIVIEPR